MTDSIPDSPSADDVYIHFSGQMNKKNHGELRRALRAVRDDVHQIIHLGLYSKGGTGMYGRWLHDAILDMATEVRTYNLEEVSSAALFPYVAGRKRYVNKNSTMLLHDTRKINPERSDEDLARTIENTSRLIACSTGIDISRIRAMRKNGTRLTAEEAVEHGFAHAIKPFVVPEGATLIRIGRPYEPRKRRNAH